jgi:hypothetical protein
MSTNYRRRLIAGCLSSVILASPLLAHHSFAMFDHTRTLTLKGRCYPIPMDESACLYRESMCRMQLEK